jgi:hypothetical protein
MALTTRGSLAPTKDRPTHVGATMIYKEQHDSFGVTVNVVDYKTGPYNQEFWLIETDTQSRWVTDVKLTTVAASNGSTS